MGADLIVATLVVPDGVDPLDEDSVVEWGERLKAQVDAADLAAIREADDFLTGGSFFEEEWGTEEEWADGVRSDLKIRIDETFHVGPNQPRDLTVRKIKDFWLLIAGGTSWGDGFESSDCIWALDAMGIDW